MPKTHVTVIDDDPEALASVCALLELFDYQIHPFDSAEAFLESDLVSKTSCLLADIQLPGISGRELQLTLNENGFCAPIMLISGHADSELTQQAIRDGASAVLEKPISPRSLIEHIERAMAAPARNIDSA